MHWSLAKVIINNSEDKMQHNTYIGPEKTDSSLPGFFKKLKKWEIDNHHL